MQPFKFGSSAFKRFQYFYDPTYVVSFNQTLNSWRCGPKICPWLCVPRPSCLCSTPNLKFKSLLSRLDTRYKNTPYLNLSQQTLQIDHPHPAWWEVSSSRTPRPQKVASGLFCFPSTLDINVSYTSLICIYIYNYMYIYIVI